MRKGGAYLFDSDSKNKKAITVKELDKRYLLTENIQLEKSFSAGGMRITKLANAVNVNDIETKAKVDGFNYLVKSNLLNPPKNPEAISTWKLLDQTYLLLVALLQPINSNISYDFSQILNKKGNMYITVTKTGTKLNCVGPFPPLWRNIVKYYYVKL